MSTPSRGTLAALMTAACLMCAGCGSEPPQAEPATGDATDTSQSGTGNVQSCDTISSSSDVTECELELHDGTRVTCAAMLSYKAGGLSCDWEHAAKAE